VVKTLIKDATVVVHKSPTCGCCGKWVDHLDKESLSNNVNNHPNMGAVKAIYGIEHQYGSCHTSISKQGYAFEGHVPAKFIKQFLEQPPKDAIGLAVPGMPVGSPGMEVGERFDAYEVLLLLKDGTSEVYATINSYEEQF